MTPLTATVLLAFSAAGALAQGAFTYVKHSDPMSDADRSFVSTRTGERSLAWKCLSDGLNVGFRFNKYFIGDDGTVRVQHRFPPAPAAPEGAWDRSVDKTAPFLPMNS